VLFGGGGNDTFVFDTRLARTNVDTVTDFQHGHDHITLGHTVFAGLGTNGTLAHASFVANTTGAAETHSQHIIYDTKTGALFYDHDGAGGHAAVEFAVLAHHPAVVAADFLLG
jgi:Ca2+-binding RTX toxin-like protein